METLKSLFSRLLYSVALPAGIIVGSLYIFYYLGNVMLLAAIVGAFAIGFFAIYLVFKYWISPNEEHETPQQQMARFMIVSIINLGINAEIVYYLVNYAAVDVYVAQAISAVIVAYVSFYAYRSLVFYVNTKRSVAEVMAADAAAKAASAAH